MKTRDRGKKNHSKQEKGFRKRKIKRHQEGRFLKKKKSKAEEERMCECVTVSHSKGEVERETERTNQRASADIKATSGVLSKMACLQNAVFAVQSTL